MYLLKTTGKLSLRCKTLDQMYLYLNRSLIYTANCSLAQNSVVAEKVTGREEVVHIFPEGKLSCGG